MRCAYDDNTVMIDFFSTVGLFFQSGHWRTLQQFISNSHFRETLSYCMLEKSRLSPMTPFNPGQRLFKS